MNDRARAIAILQRAKSLLLERLAGRIVESEAEIIDDAEGNTYLSEIDAVHEHVGMRLAHVNALLANLTAAATPTTAKPKSTSPAVAGYLVDASRTGLAATGLALVPSRSPRPAIRFQTFLQQAVAGNLDEASQVLTELFDLSYVRGRESAQAFQQRLRTEPDFVALALRLHFALGAGPSRNAAVLISECFGLSDEESLRAAQAVQARARKSASR